MIIGIDEVGRGAWAGPLVVGAVSLDVLPPELKDSKLLTKSLREKLVSTIQENASFVGLGWVSASEVDDLGLTKATSLACERAIKKAPKDSEIIIDGSINYLPNLTNVKTIIKGDENVPEISAASIVAKVARDHHMLEQHKAYHNYGFDKNVGYGTKAHVEAIKIHGLTPLHRWSYKPIVEILNSYET